MFEMMYFFYMATVVFVFLPLALFLSRHAIRDLVRGIYFTLKLPWLLYQRGLTGVQSEYRARIPLVTWQYAALIFLLSLNSSILYVGIFSLPHNWPLLLVTILVVEGVLTSFHWIMSREILVPTSR